ncbi:type II toxin-antitoxin system PemK/MazF family toxin [Okeania sp. SIO1I7]|uniref:type II toxin-antitoxin system PemK/MazF family toxin n=1 Tax=Okeania sp. SIO1I7 TaxID=2607772 RepID=UPI0013FA1611|nr:type II toxin-antitoxin system PemK/MazF family toxin [Okeania sp. SIO1I7]NET26606.1 type II toxin-antitoxin system PemK/MazF family toxin [Okeania sp. SIO1I7]
MKNDNLPKRGDIWLTNFDPTIGAEIRKIRPAIIISSDGIGRLPIKLIAPITDWKNYFNNDSWHIKIEPDLENNLSKVSTVDLLQIRGMDLQRLVKKIGVCSSEVMDKISAGIALLVEYEG